MTLVLSSDTRNPANVRSHGVSGYNNDCRCSICSSANKAKGLKGRASRKIKNKIAAPNKVVSAKSAAMELARQDMTDILDFLAVDPDWQSVLTNAVAGEIEAFTCLADAHNRSGNVPRIRYWTDHGVFRVSGEMEAETVRAETPVTRKPALQLPVTEAASKSAGTGAVQLPQMVPLARPRDVRAGKAPSVAVDPVRSPNSNHTDRPVSEPPTWG